jgi:hypothetical protein
MEALKRKTHKYSELLGPLSRIEPLIFREKRHSFLSYLEVTTVFPECHSDSPPFDLSNYCRAVACWIADSSPKWGRFCVVSRKVAGSIPYEVIGFFNWSNPSSRTVALWSTQPLTEKSTRNRPGGNGRWARKADNLITICEAVFYKMW